MHIYVGVCVQNTMKKATVYIVFKYAYTWYTDNEAIKNSRPLHTSVISNCTQNTEINNWKNSPSGDVLYMSR